MKIIIKNKINPALKKLSGDEKSWKYNNKKSIFVGLKPFQWEKKEKKRKILPVIILLCASLLNH